MYGFLEHSCIPASYSLKINFPQLIDIEDFFAEERTDYRIEEKDNTTHSADDTCEIKT